MVEEEAEAEKEEEEEEEEKEEEEVEEANGVSFCLSETFFGGGDDVICARVLALLVIPGHLTFSLAIRMVQTAAEEDDDLFGGRTDERGGGGAGAGGGEGGGGGGEIVGTVNGNESSGSKNGEELTMGFYCAYLLAAFTQVNH